MEKAKSIIGILLILLFSVSVSFATGTVTQTHAYIGKDMMSVVFSCTGDSTDGSIDDTDTNAEITGKIAGFYIYRIIIENDSGDTSVTSNADVYIRDSGGTDLLNGQGENMLDDNTRNFIRLYRKDPIVGALTLDVDNQATASGVYTVTLILSR